MKKKFKKNNWKNYKNYRNKRKKLIKKIKMFIKSNNNLNKSMLLMKFNNYFKMKAKKKSFNLKK